VIPPVEEIYARWKGVVTELQPHAASEIHRLVWNVRIIARRDACGYGSRQLIVLSRNQTVTKS
jgi:hypothetical protein